ncbi:winged helix-turn-helix domain-containing protein [Cohnella zeiphila]|uniref:Winged helix-turn-helix transcriptional regulator n=1 Tax=Cohnella zeiphila TaxID=2761120 RepID=A0A7X0SK41_9BACL|nr:winged helix-turn-helix domain-containing protein [Cohnella zeiphila]MBB6731321.1 winged helix-turn-helix transcriptional regulator [Cohnella zeiphila]
MPNVEPGPVTPQPPVFAEGDFCLTTRRIVLISPFPARLQSLVTELMSRCYDVLLFHNEDESLLPHLDNDLIIADRSYEGLDSAANGTADRSGWLILIGENARPPAEAASLVWPCPVGEALAKIESLVVESKPAAVAAPGHPELLRFKNLEMDLKRFLLYKDGRRLDLTKTEFDLLKLLLASAGVLSRQEIMESIWGDGYFGGSNSIDVHIKSLRQKLGDDPKQPIYIVTVRGVGYRIAE